MIPEVMISASETGIPKTEATMMIVAPTNSTETALKIQITEICILRADSGEFVGETIIIVASVFGIPVSLAEIITSGIIGFSCANQGFTATARNNHVLRIAFFWFLVPFFAVAASYFMSSLYFKYGVAAMLGKNF